LPQTTPAVGAWIEKECGIIYESRSGLIALLRRLGQQVGTKLHLIPTCCPHIDPIERLWG
jgi:hypothetical protein